MKGDLVVYGKGGHATVAEEIAHLSGYHVVGYFDDTPVSESIAIPYSPTYLPQSFVHVAIGNNAVRKVIFDKVKHPIVSLIHPTAIIAGHVDFGRGCLVGARAVIQPWSEIGEGTILNTGCIIEHHNQIGEYCHIAPGAVLCGNVKVGNQTLIGANATVVPGISIGAFCLIKAGSVVKHDLPDHTIYG